MLIGYQHRRRLAAPVIRLVLSRLLGWKFDGSPAHCRRLAARLPLIAFRPVDEHGAGPISLSKSDGDGASPKPPQG